MILPPPSKRIAGACRLYRGLINLYPGGFRYLYATEMLRAFEDDWNRVRGQGMAARCNFGVHVSCDLARTLPGEWLASLPFRIVAGLFGIVAVVSLWAMGHQLVAIADWAFCCAFGILCWTVLIRPVRRGIASSLLVAGVLGWGGIWAQGLLAEIMPHSRSHADLLIAAICVQGLLFPIPYLFSPYENRWLWTTWLNRRQGGNVIFRKLLGVLCLLATVGSQLRYMATDAGSQITSSILLLAPSLYVTRELVAIWRVPGRSQNPDPEPRVA